MRRSESGSTEVRKERSESGSTDKERSETERIKEFSSSFLILPLFRSPLFEEIHIKNNLRTDPYVSRAAFARLDPAGPKDYELLLFFADARSKEFAMRKTRQKDQSRLNFF